MSHHQKLLSAVIALAYEADLTRQPSAVRQVVGQLLACLPGSEELDGLQIAPLHDGISWREFGLIGEIISAVKSKKDVEALCIAMVAPDEVMTRWNQRP